MKVREVMTAPAVCAAPDVPPAVVAGRMAGHAPGSVLAVADGRPRGIVTDRDLAVRGPGGGPCTRAPVHAVMSPHTVTAGAGDDLEVAYRAFRRTGVRRLPVPDAGRPVGVLTIDGLFLDVFRHLADLLGPVATGILRQAPRPSSPPGAPDDA
ncbi:cyclic nucleotide-binding/CBS domain-containing protein [Streptomyces sp. NPDC004065]|uniref:CBS domain-containing protein n=1 Tax=Streptomyces sp. NPDC004065 TaxID=3364689 RepID=UPI003850525E